jgi:hypothetical protein
VIAAVDLDELAEAGPPVTRLVGAPDALAPRQPDPGRGHPRAEGFTAHLEVVPLEQLLPRQHRPEVWVVLTDEGDDALLELRWQATVARPAPMP